MNKITLEKELKKAVENLREDYKSPVSIETIRLIFNVSLLRALKMMCIRKDHRGDERKLSASSHWYLTDVLGLDEDELPDYCNRKAERRDYDYDRAVTYYFFDHLTDEFELVEDQLASFAMEFPDFYVWHGDWPDFSDDSVVIGLIKEASDIRGEWKYADYKKAQEIVTFLSSI